MLILTGMQCLFVAAADFTADYQVIPLPQEVSLTAKAPFVLNASTAIVYPEGNADMQRNADFLAGYIKDNTGLNLQVTSAKGKSGIKLALDKKAAQAEGYTIRVTAKEVLISGSTPQGVFYGIQTLRKSLPVGNGIAQVELPAVVIKDAPRFGYRGMHLDCGRHFFPISFVKK